MEQGTMIIVGPIKSQLYILDLRFCSETYLLYITEQGAIYYGGSNKNHKFIY